MMKSFVYCLTGPWLFYKQKINDNNGHMAVEVETSEKRIHTVIIDGSSFTFIDSMALHAIPSVSISLHLKSASCLTSSPLPKTTFVVALLAGIRVREFCSNTGSYLGTSSRRWRKIPSRGACTGEKNFHLESPAPVLYHTQGDIVFGIIKNLAICF